MNVVVLSCNHHSAGLEIREKLAFPSEEKLSLAYAHWQKQHPESELVLLSTCNRVELYAAADVETQRLSPDHLIRFVSEFHNLPSDEFVSSVLYHHGEKAVEHLFEVVCSLDSMVLGEPQIVQQVKEAYRVAHVNNACGLLTNMLFQQALKVSGQVRTQTKLSEGRVSIASVAVGDFARSIFNRFDNKTVLVIGAGEMAEETLRYLKDEGVRNIVVVNRHRERADALAEKFGGTTDSFDNLDNCMKRADVIVSTTGAASTLVDYERFRRVRAESDRHPVFILDLGAPRDFAHEIADIDDNVFLYDIDALEATCEQNRQNRMSEVRKARQIITVQTERFMQEFYHRATGPVIQRLREQMGEISRNELDILFRRLPDLDSAERAAIEKTVHRIINKLLHPPLETLKGEARSGTPHGLLDAIRRLFNLTD
ncbi:MAG: glutamyl-tRNA reductase [Planctomycetaceae bacterium]|nr:glutamyl-tRNA reductase [Planctomycetaceae bacterium]